MRAQRSSVLIGCLAALLTNPNAHAQTACASVTGSWTDHEGNVWSVNQSSTGTVSGTLSAVSGCAATSWPVQGSYIGNGNFTFRVSNPSPPHHGDPDFGSCARWAIIQGGMIKPGCHTAVGTWNNSLSENGTWQGAKPCDIPTGYMEIGRASCRERV